MRVSTLEVGPVPTDLLANLDHPLPTKRSFARLRRMQLMPNVSADARRPSPRPTVSRGDKRSIWLPRRAFLFGVLTGAPQRIVGPLIAGIH
jgi:hypothetical protein